MHLHFNGEFTVGGRENRTLEHSHATAFFFLPFFLLFFFQKMYKRKILKYKTKVRMECVLYIKEKKRVL